MTETYLRLAGATVFGLGIACLFAAGIMWLMFKLEEHGRRRRALERRLKPDYSCGPRPWHVRSNFDVAGAMTARLSKVADRPPV